MKFEKYYRNDPFWVPKAELLAMTDKEVYEVFYQAYEKPDVNEKIAQIDQHQAAFEKAYLEKPLEDRRREYYAMCRDYKIPEKEIDAKWDRYLRTGSTE